MTAPQGLRVLLRLTEGKDDMGKRFAIVIGAAALGAALIATGASANFRSVDDPRGDTGCGRRRAPRLARTRRAQCRHRQGDGGPRRQAAEAHDPRRRQDPEAFLLINTDSDRDCELFVVTRRGQGRSEFRECSAALARHRPREV